MVQAIDPNYSVDWYRTPVPREVLEELNRRSDLKGFIQAGGHLALIVTTGVLAWLAYQRFGWIGLLPALFLHGIASSFCINAVHELVHGTVFQTKALNEVFATLFAFPGWINHHAFWASHAEHHKFTLHDPHDQEVVVPMEVTLRDFLRALTINLGSGKWHIGHAFRLARGRIVSEWGMHLYGNQERRFRIFNWARVLVVGHAAIAAVSLYHGQWLIPVLTSLTPLYTGGLQFLLNQTQHVGLQDHVSDFRLNARTFHTNRLFRFLFWNMNYHIEHHMYAGVPCYNLPKLHEAVRHELPYTFRGLKEVWFHIIAVLYRQKEEPGYVYVPLIPGIGRPASAQPPQVALPDPTVLGPLAAEAGSGEVADPGAPDGDYKVWECSVCGFIYDERLGLPEEGLAPGTRWADIPEDWRCPDCGVAKADFTMVEVKAPPASMAFPVAG